MRLSDLGLRNASSWTMFIFGVLAAALGALGLLQPETLLNLLSFQVIDRTARVAGDYTLVFITASSMAAVNMGIYYVLASLNNMKKFYAWTVPFRVLTFIAFLLAVIGGVAPVGFIGVGAWELLGAIATGMALISERAKESTS